jgi:hypothetical protein
LVFVAPLLVLGAAGCQKNPNLRSVGQTTFVSAPPGGGSASNAAFNGAAAPTAASNARSGTDQSSTPARTVEETDLYRLDGTRLYYLNGYRGLMVFDVTNVDQPRLLGRAPIYGWPVDMIVRNGVATVVVADWYGALADGTPFHGSVVRGFDASDPTNIRILGDAPLGGWVSDTRVVGDVLYAVSVDYGWSYGFAAPYLGGGVGVATAPAGHVSNGAVGGAVGIGGPTRETVIVSSVDFAGGMVRAVGNQRFDGYSGIFNVTPNAIMLAHDVGTSTNAIAGNMPAQTELLYLDISDPAGAIVRRGAITVHGRPDGWGADNGRWNLDFADGRTAHVVGCANLWCGSGDAFVLTTADFSNPDAPALVSELDVPSPGWSVTARFDTGRLYLSPQDYSVNAGGTTPFQVYDLSDGAHPALAGTVQIPGTVWNILLAPNHRLFALGNDWNMSPVGGSEQVSLKYLDVTDPAHPALLGTSTFGQGWAWTPAAGTFKAFTMDAMQGLVVLPFSGWDYTSSKYNNGLQLIEFTDTTERTAGAARTRGWVERGIFVQNRLVSLSDLALAVVDYTNHDSPSVVTELALARNVIAAQPQGTTLAEVSSDWWDNDVTTSLVRVLPLADAEELSDQSGAPSVSVDGIGARVFRNGDLAYVVTSVRVAVPCDNTNNNLPGGIGTKGGLPSPGGTGSSTIAPVCYGGTEQVQVVDLSNGAARLRGQVRLPTESWGGWGWSWGGYFWYDWFGGADVVQVGADALAFRRWTETFDQNGHLTTSSILYVVDLSNADAPAQASLTITNDPNAWWGNLRVVGTTLYSTHYVWTNPFPQNAQAGVAPAEPTVRYYADRVDLSDRAHPRLDASINVPGFLVGGQDSDPSVLYFIDYRWGQANALDMPSNDFDVVRVNGNTATLLSTTSIDGWVGSTIIRGTKAYTSAARYDQATQTGILDLHAIDLSNPNAPVDRVASGRNGWGWLLDVEGDRAVVTSGWGDAGVDIYALSDTAPPVFSQFVRTRGWSVNSIARQDNALYLASGYWGTQRIDLQ